MRIGGLNEVIARYPADTPAEEEASLRAMNASRREDAASIRQHRARGMSRKRLIDIYGRDLVDSVLGAN